MKEQQPLSDVELKHAFEDAIVQTRDAHATKGAAQMLGLLSKSIQGLQAQGADIALTVIGGGHSNAYDMIYTTSGMPKGETEVEAYGLVHAGEGTRLFAVVSQYGAEPVQRIYVSKFNTNFEGGRSSSSSGATQNARITGTLYDFEADEKALQKLQMSLAKFAAENAVILEHDTENVFNRKNGSLPHKPGSKLRL